MNRLDLIFETKFIPTEWSSTYHSDLSYKQYNHGLKKLPLEVWEFFPPYLSGKRGEKTRLIIPRFHSLLRNLRRFPNIEKYEFDFLPMKLMRLDCECLKQHDGIKVAGDSVVATLMYPRRLNMNFHHEVSQLFALEDDGKITIPLKNINDLFDYMCNPFPKIIPHSPDHHLRLFFKIRYCVRDVDFRKEIQILYY